jgi:hypothetical protein
MMPIYNTTLHNKLLLLLLTTTPHNIIRSHTFKSRDDDNLSLFLSLSLCLSTLLIEKRKLSTPPDGFCIDAIMPPIYNTTLHNKLLLLLLLTTNIIRSHTFKSRDDDNLSLFLSLSLSLSQRC